MFSAVARFVTCLLAAVIGMAVIGGVLAAGGAQSPPPWLLIAMLLLPTLLACVLFAALARRKPSRIALREDGVQTGGWLLGRDVPYDDVRLLKLERPEKTVGDRCLLAVAPNAGARIQIWLDRPDATECFDALRDVCARAPAIDLDGRTHPPRDPIHLDAGTRTLAREYRRRATWSLLAAVLLGSVAVVCIAAMFVGWSRGSGGPNPIFRAIVFSALALGALGTSVEHRRRARAIESAGQRHPPEPHR